MKICIYGGGSLGLVCAAVFSHQGIDVSLVTKHPENWQNEVEAHDPDGKIYKGNIKQISSSAEQIVPSCDMVLLCVPGFLIETALHEIKDHLKAGALVGSIVSNTGFFIFAHEILAEGTALFGFQRVPYIARAQEYGKKGNLLGYKSQLAVALENVADAEAVRVQLENLFLTPVKLLNNFYEASLSNSNPILHTGRMYSMLNGWNGEPFADRVLFYEDWNDDSSRELVKMDEEFMQLLDKLNVDKKVIPSLLEYYESCDESALTRKLASIQAFKGIYAPMKQVEGGWIPDVESRYFTEDFPFGLRLIYELCVANGVSCPNIEKVYKWGVDFMHRYKV